MSGHKEPERSFESQIAELFCCFDFKRVHQTMRALRWYWKDANDENYIPDIDTMKSKASEYVLECVKHYKQNGEAFGTGSGGFEASVDAQGYLSLSFVVSEWSCGIE